MVGRYTVFGASASVRNVVVGRSLVLLLMLCCYVIKNTRRAATVWRVRGFATLLSLNISSIVSTKTSEPNSP